MVLLGFSVVLARGIGRANVLAPSPLIGRSAPSFDLARFDTGRLSTAGLSNTVYVVNFWASWCVPCREEAATLQAFAARHTSGDVALVGVLFADDLSPARAFVNEFKLTYPQLQDPTGRTAVDYGVRGVPETFVVDQRGVVMASLIGAISPGTLDGSSKPSTPAKPSPHATAATAPDNPPSNKPFHLRRFVKGRCRCVRRDAPGR